MNNHNLEFTDSYIDSVRQAYDRDGYVRFPGVIPAKRAKLFGNELTRLIVAENNNAQWESGVDNEEPDEMVIFDLHDVHKQSKKFDRLRRDPRILPRLAILLGGSPDSTVINHHDKGFIKPGAKDGTVGGKFPPHQDYPFFPHQDDRMLATILYLTDITEDMGPVKIIPGSHRGGPIEHLRTKGKEPYLDDADYPDELFETMTGNAGDMVAFNINTVHKSGLNRSLTDRVSWLLQVRHEDNHPRLSAFYVPEPFEGEKLWPRP